MAEISELLSRATTGDAEASNELFPLIYDELRCRATFYMSRQPADHTLQATALVHEAFVKLVGKKEAVSFECKTHFFNAAAEAMRQILIDHARLRAAAKRGGGYQRIDLEQADLALQVKDVTALQSLHAALEKLKEMGMRRYQVVMQRYFAGLTEQEIADNLRVSVKTVQRDWLTAKTYLFSQITQHE